MWVGFFRQNNRQKRKGFLKKFANFVTLLIMSFYREQKCIDFKKIDAHVHQLKGSSSRYILLRNAYMCVCV